LELGAGGTQRRVLGGTPAHSGPERNNTSEQSRGSGKGAMEAL